MTTETDRQQLELAAKAAGIEWTDGQNGEMMVAPHVKGMAGCRKPWNPRDDDGDSLRLAVKCKIEFYEGDDDGPAAYAGYYAPYGDTRRQRFMTEPHADHADPCAATRLAIFRAAVEIGKAMK